MYSPLTHNGFLPRSVYRYAKRHSYAVQGWPVVGAVPGLEDVGFLGREQTTDRQNIWRSLPPLGSIGESPLQDLSSMSATVLPPVCTRISTASPRRRLGPVLLGECPRRDEVAVICRGAGRLSRP